jgi:TRAP-type C4-dicarboxylate transport system permease small subunit
MSGRLDRWEKFTQSLSRWVSWVGGVCLVAMLALTVADIIGIKFFKYPVPGAIEIVGFLGVTVAAFALAHTYVLRGHIRVEFFTMQMPARLQASINAFVSLISTGFFVVLAWQCYAYGRVLQRTGEVSMTQKIPFYPFVYTIAFCCLPICLLLLVEFLQSVMKAVRK